MAKLNEKQLTFEGVMRIVQGNKWILLKDIERLEKFIQNQQATIQSLKEENEQLKKEYKITIDEMVTDYKKLEKENEQLKSENKKLEQQYHNLVNAIVKTCNDLGKENIYLGDFDICKRITEYEKE